MIRRIEIIYKVRSVWARGTTFDATPTVPLKGGQVLFERDYPRGVRTSEIWRELQTSMINNFFLIFYPAVVWQTAPPEPPTSVPQIAIRRQTDHIKERQAELPEYYIWNPKEKKYHMSVEGYEKRTKELGGPMVMSVAEGPFEDMYDYTLLDDLQEEFAGKTLTLILFVYPDRYDEEIRSMFEMRITFW